MCMRTFRSSWLSFFFGGGGEMGEDLCKYLDSFGKKGAPVRHVLSECEGPWLETDRFPGMISCIQLDPSHSPLSPPLQPTIRYGHRHNFQFCNV